MFDIVVNSCLGPPSALVLRVVVVVVVVVGFCLGGGQLPLLLIVHKLIELSKK